LKKGNLKSYRRWNRNEVGGVKGGVLCGRRGQREKEEESV